MGLLEDILAWSEELPAWQRDALRRLFLDGKLSLSDHAELLAMVKEEHGAGPHAGVQPIPLSVEHIPHAGVGKTVHLLKLQHLQHVNRFPTDRFIDFEPDRLNVLFGENGTGKSGYARVLKNTCRARFRQPVLPDAFDETTPRPIPSADITFSVDGAEPQTFTWKQGAVSDPSLANVAVYDSACGADYLAREGASSYQPYGLPYLKRLADAQREMQTSIDGESNHIRLDPGAFADLHGEHEVGQLLANIGKDTALDRLRTLANLSSNDSNRIEELTTVLSTMSPEPEARAVERLAQRMESAAEIARKAQTLVTDRALEDIRQLLRSRRAAQTAWTLAQEQLHRQEQPRQNSDREGAALLVGTGNEVWKELYEAAERFSTQYAYPDREHPNVDDNARCVLCQAPLSKDAKERMLRFAKYVADDALRNATDRTNGIKTALEAINTAVWNPFDVPTWDELAATDASLSTFAKKTMDNWIGRSEWVRNCIETGVWTISCPPCAGGDTLDERLCAKATALRTRAQEFRCSLNPDVKARLEKEHASLVARQRLAGRMTRIEQYVADATTRHNLRKCHDALNTYSVSTKMTRLASVYITEALADAMNAELKALGYRRRVEPDITGRTDAGQTMVTLKIKGCRDSTSRVLSEGEQRAMGLALFLAEVGLQDHKSTIVFDDPSTSFDHRHRRNMALRLASLALDRPVLVLTHDAVFLTELDGALALNQHVTYRTVAWNGNRPGFVERGLTWETMDTNARLSDLQRSVGPLKAYGDEYVDEATNEQIKTAYTKLRGTIERAIREVFLNNTIRPFSENVSVDSFGAVIGQSQEEWDKVSEIYDRCCEVTDGHDTSGEHQLPIPEPATLLNDVESFRMSLEAAKKRRTTYETARSERNKARKQPFTS